MHLSSSPYMLHALPISFFLILSDESIMVLRNLRNHFTEVKASLSRTLAYSPTIQYFTDNLYILFQQLRQHTANCSK
jgi:hypothetical protein